MHPVYAEPLNEATATSSEGRLVLGLDIGTASVGWALVREQTHGGSVIALGTRVFSPPGTTDVGSITRGRDDPPGQARRAARLVRRQTRRRRQRRRRIWGALVKGGLFPQGVAAEHRAAFLRGLDGELAGVLAAAGVAADSAKLPYQYRTFALDHGLAPTQFGRVLMHLGMRRGFLSNRRAARVEDDDQSVVKAAISDLAAHTSASGSRTLGEYLSRLDPREERIRSRWTSRAMYVEEFERLIEAQRRLGVTLSDRNVRRIRSAMFTQRPLRSVRHFTGRCELESVHGVGPRRCPMADPLAQEFRYLQRVNDLRVITAVGEVRPLTSEEREAVLGALASTPEVTFAQLRKRLGLPRGTRFNLEEGGEKRLIGARTLAGLAAVIGAQWTAARADWRDTVVRLVLSVDDDEVLVRHLRTRCALPEDVARQVVALPIEPGYLAFSRRALRKLLPLMQTGMPFATARLQLYGGAPMQEPDVRLPPVRKVFPMLRNPIVVRALTETRRVINALIAEGHRPDVVRIELARDLKRNRIQRQRLSAGMRSREAERERAATALRAGAVEPTRRQIEKYLLWEECNRTCPYTGRPITFDALFGDTPTFDVEHIVPFSRSLDDSFLNKTLCEVRENRTGKGDRTPHEAYSGSPEVYGAILERVRHFVGDDPERKLERFTMPEVPEDLASRHLNDTRYAAVCAVTYLARLFGGTVDAQGVQRVYATSGGLTWLLRRQWALDRVLGDGERKTRDDHRHHAVDAAVVAMTSPASVRALQRAAASVGPVRAASLHLAPPWRTFAEEVGRAVHGMIVSQRVTRRVSGPLHEETHYGQTAAGATRVRKLLKDLTADQVAAIADARVRTLVVEALAGGDPKKVFSADERLPKMPNRRGPPIPIRRVRITKTDNPVLIGAGPRTQRVLLGNNHHVVVHGTRAPDGRVTAVWWVPVSLLEVARRVSHSEPVVQPDAQCPMPFLFSLAKGDTVACGPMERSDYLVVEKLATTAITCRLASDARPVTARIRERITLSRAKICRDGGFQKLRVSPTGRVSLCND